MVKEELRELAFKRLSDESDDDADYPDGPKEESDDEEDEDMEEVEDSPKESGGEEGLNENLMF